MHPSRQAMLALLNTHKKEHVMKAKISKNQKLFRKLMQRFMAGAWKMAYKAAKQFGGKASDYFAESLRLIWAENYAKQLRFF